MIDINEIHTASRIDLSIAAIECGPDLSATNTWGNYSKKPVAQEDWDHLVAKAVAPIASDNPFLQVDCGEVSAIEALNHNDGAYGLDVRPRFFDNVSKTWTLLDSGSCVSCIPREDKDVIDPNLRLKAVNGSFIPTYGSQIITIQIGRKTYQIQAIKIDIQQRIHWATSREALEAINKCELPRRPGDDVR